MTFSTFKYTSTHVVSFIATSIHHDNSYIRVAFLNFMLQYSFPGFSLVRGATLKIIFLTF